MRLQPDVWQKPVVPDDANPSAGVAADAVPWAAENGITGGTTDTTFRPNSDCTRAQIVAFLYGCLGDESDGTKDPLMTPRRGPACEANSPDTQVRAVLRHCGKSHRLAGGQGPAHGSRLHSVA